LNPAVAGSTNRRAVRWLRGQLPELVAAGAISSENARAIERHYESVKGRTNFGFVILVKVEPGGNFDGKQHIVIPFTQFWVAEKIAPRSRARLPRK
jgi:hypothetical protein